MASSLPSLAPGRNFCAKEVTAPHRNPVQTIRVIGRPARLYVTTRSTKITLKGFFPKLPFMPYGTPNNSNRHLFIDCVQASAFWFEFQNWRLQLCYIELALCPSDVLHGIIHQLIPPCLLLNHLVILGKYFTNPILLISYH